MAEIVDRELWVVFEANSIIPAIFTDRDEAYAYRTWRAKQVRHQVYVMPAILNEQAGVRR